MIVAFILKIIGAVCFIFAFSILVDAWLTGSERAKKQAATSPEIWRQYGTDEKSGQRVFRRVAGMTLLYSILWPLFFIFFQPGIFLEQFVGNWARGPLVGVMIWAMVLLPVYLTNQILVKYHRGMTRAYLFSWLIKFMVSGLLLAKIF